MKLNRNQRAALAYLADVGPLTVPFPGTGADLRTTPARCRIATLQSLEHAGLAMFQGREHGGWLGQWYAITSAGRRARARFRP